MALSELSIELQLTTGQVEREATHHEGRTASKETERRLAKAKDRWVAQGVVPVSGSLVQIQFQTLSTHLSDPAAQTPPPTFAPPIQHPAAEQLVTVTSAMTEAL